MRRIVQVVYVPLMFGGGGGAAVWVGSRGGVPTVVGSIVLGAIAWSFLAERIAPYEGTWNWSHGDRWRDVAHAVVNETLNVCSVAVIGVVGGLGVSRWWPTGWPFVVQFVFAIVALDAGVTLTHWQSHRRDWLWRFHAVHHSVERMYGLNGIMKHPVHQTVEMLAGAAPLVVLGMPSGVAASLVACTAIQLLLQHSNVDYRVGRLRAVLALNEAHRFHHVRAVGAGDVNFGLFTTLWDRLLGTWTFDPARRFTSADLGIAGRRDYPRGYLAQLREPFRA